MTSERSEGKRAARRAVLVLAALLAASREVRAAEAPLVPASGTPVDVTAGWALSPDDRPSYASPDLDDAAWPRVRLDEAWSETQHGRYAGVRWFRLTTRVASAAPMPLAIGLGRLYLGAYEVFAGGRLVGRAGSLPPKIQICGRRPESFEIPKEALGTDGRLVLALRVFRDPELALAAKRGTSRFPVGQFLLGAAEPVRTALELEYLRILRSDLSVIVCAALLAFLGLYHLNLYRRRRELKEYLWFGIIALVAPVNMLLLTRAGVTWFPSMLTVLSLAMASYHLNSIVWIELVGCLLRRRWPWWVRAYQAVQLIFFLITLAAPRLVLGPLANAATASMLPIMFLFLVYLPWKAWRGDPNARSIWVGTFAVGLVRLYTGVGMALGRPYLVIAHWAFAVVIIAFAAALAERFSRVHFELDAARQDLERKVEERTSELARTVERLEVSERLAHEANEAKTTFLSNMSHELRTPLSAVIGFAQLLERDARLGGETRTELRIIHRSGEHLLGLINDVLSLAQIESGALKLSEQPFDLHELLAAVHGIVSPRAAAKDLELVFDVAEPVPVEVMGDGGRLRQVLINLLGNAVKFTPRGSVTLRVRAEGKRVRFEVEDTGPGIAPEELSRLFRPFSQTETGRAAREGTGLGLVISRQIVQLMGGDISVDSRTGSGTTFSFDVVLPAAEAPAKRTRRREVLGLAPDQEPVRILVVDDTLENRLLLTRLLESAGFEVREAVNGLTALEEWERWSPRLVFMDVRMPVLDGREATRRIRARDPERATRIVVLTASAFAHEHADLIACGADAVLTKPFHVSDVFEVVAAQLGVRYTYADERTSRNLLPSFLPGVDVKAGVARAGGNASVYRQGLEHFLEELEPLPARLLALLEEGQREILAAELHRLKGTAATLGARRLAEAAGEAERALDAGTPGAALAGVEAAAEEVLRSLARVARQRRSADALEPAADTPEEPTPAHEEDVRQILERLAAHVASSNMAASDEAERLASALPARLSPEADELRRCLFRIDFEAAQAVLTRIDAGLRAG